MPQATKKTKNQASKTKKSSKKVYSSVLGNLTESIEHLGFIQQISAILSELEDRAGDVQEEASKEIKKLMKTYDAKYKSIEKKINKITKEAKQKAELGLMTLVSKWHEHKEILPESVSKEIESLVGKGLKAITTKTKKTAPKKRAPAKKSAVKKKASSAKKAAKATKTTAAKRKKASATKKTKQPKKEDKTTSV